MIIRVSSDGQLRYGAREYRCALGKGGVVRNKREGDGATPIGLFRLLAVHFRHDRVGQPITRLPTRAIGKRDGWCDNPNHSAYNTRIVRPFRGSHEALWRDDHLYDIVIEIDHNTHPAKRGAGSAIFIHVATPDYASTEGCIALAKKDLRNLLQRWTPETRILIAGADH